jgi:hypothetical protein
LGHNIHAPIHGLCNQLFLYSQSNQANCCHLVMLFSVSTRLWKASSCLSVCLHTTTQLLLGGFSWNLIFLTRIMSTLHEAHCTFLIICRPNLIRMRNVSDKSCR